MKKLCLVLTAFISLNLLAKVPQWSKQTNFGKRIIDTLEEAKDQNLGARIYKNWWQRPVLSDYINDWPQSASNYFLSLFAYDFAMEEAHKIFEELKIDPRSEETKIRLKDHEEELKNLFSLIALKRVEAGILDYKKEKKQDIIAVGPITGLIKVIGTLSSLKEVFGILFKRYKVSDYRREIRNILRTEIFNIPYHEREPGLAVKILEPIVQEIGKRELSRAIDSFKKQGFNYLKKKITK